MSKFFNLDSPVMAFLSRLWDIMVLNIFAFLFLLPVFAVLYFFGEIGSASPILALVLVFIAALPFGACLTGLHYISLKMVRKEESYIVRPFFHSVKENFRQSVIIWAIYLFFFVITGYDIYMVINDEQNIFPSWLGIALLIVSFLLLFSFLWVFPILSHFVNSVGGTLRNAVTMAIGAFPRTLLMLLILITPIAALYFIGQYIVPFLFLFGIEGPVYLCAMTYSKFFERFEPKREESQNPDAMPPVLADDLDSIDPNVFKIPGIDYDPDEVKAEESGEKDNESGKEMNQETEKAPDQEADKELGRDADGTDK